MALVRAAEALVDETLDIGADDLAGQRIGTMQTVDKTEDL